ncbi:FAD-dependent oxidoreductase [Beijerinckia mobilis]|uniref:FAD-dependent oxidoreductase n=1 Tax=Beijerinckia mobilis TaxID=231434 RepID=UPI0005595037|nr:FAD-dependent oxidoreductase [Beijerinckia mobilis]
MDSETVDVLVVGSGAGGLAAAVAAAARGLEVIVVEKEPLYGGTTAWSGGWLWIPGNPHAGCAGIIEEPASPRAYLRHILGDRYDPARIEAFLETGPVMLDFFEREAGVHFLPGSAVPDFHGDVPEAALGWRSVVAAPFDGRRLGSLIARLRTPIPETTLAGMAIASGADLRHFFHAARSFQSFLHVARRLVRHGFDLLRYGRSMQLVNGNALVAALLHAAAERGVSLRSGTKASGLLWRDGRVAGAVLDGPAGSVTVHARRAIVLAAGGFPHDLDRQQDLFPHVRSGTPHQSAAPDSNTGDGLRLAEAVGGVVDTGQVDVAAWAPVSIVPRADGGRGHFPHLIERGKPGLIAVTRNGRRFVNEAKPYHDFMRALFAATLPDQRVEAWLLCDHAFIWRYGLGAVKPFPFPLTPWIVSGYLKRGRTIEALAKACGIDHATLANTVEIYNRHAREGEDPAFGRGATPYQRVQGDAAQKPNPCVAPIEKGPFYAVRVVPGSLGTFAGLVCDAHARVLDARSRPIPGLYAAGNDMTSIMGGHYPSGGITLGPAMTFGYIAAQHIAGQPMQEEIHGRKEHA